MFLKICLLFMTSSVNWRNIQICFVSRWIKFEEDVEDGLMHGFTENYIRVAAKYDPLLINELKRVRLTAINASGHVEVEEVGEDVLVGG